MGFIVCFIDDSDFEHELVREEIATHAPGFEFVQTYTFDEALKALGAKIPVLFLQLRESKDLLYFCPKSFPRPTLALV